MLKVVVAATKQPVSIAEAKSHLRVTDSDDDADIGIYIDSARAYFERRTGTTIHETVYELSLDGFPSGRIVLPRSTPLISIESIKYTDSAAAETTLSSSLYVFDSYAWPGWVAPAYGESWPSFTPRSENPVIIRYKGGIVTTSPVTEAEGAIKEIILLLTAAFFENRETEVVGMTAAALKFGVDHLIAQHVVDYEF